MVGMPLLNLGYGLSGLTQGYNQAQQQAMQLAAQRLALQQAQSQQNAQRLASQYLQSPGFKGFGGMFGGGFNPANINPISQPAATGGATPSQAPVPPSQQQPPPANGSVGGDSSTYDQWWNNNLLGGAPWSGKVIDWERAEKSPPANGAGGADDDTDAAGGGNAKPSQTSWLSQFNPIGTAQAAESQAGKDIPIAPAPSTTPAPPSDRPQWMATPTWAGVGAGNIAPQVKVAPRDVTPTPSTQPAPGPSSSAQPEEKPSTKPDASTDAGGSGQMGITIGNQTIPLSQFFGSVDYGQIAQGIAKIAPPGTDQADIYQAVVDLSKLAEGNKTQQQQAGLILRELIGHPFKMEEIKARDADAAARQQSGQAFRAGEAQKSRDFRASQEQKKEDFRAAQAELRAGERAAAALAKSHPQQSQEAVNISREIRAILSRHQADPSIDITDVEQERIKQLTERLAKINNMAPTQ